MAKVFIAPGHGGADSGAVANGFKEKDLNLAISLVCRDELVRHGVTVEMSKEVDEGESLAQQVNECNAFCPDLAVNIHNNAGGGDGAEVFYSISGSGKPLAVNILDEIVKIGQNSRGAKTRKNSSGIDYYGFIRSTKAPAVIVECAFLDHKKDIQIIDTAAEQKAMGIAIAKGVLKTLGIAYKAQEAPAVEDKPVTPAPKGNTINLRTLSNGSKGEDVRALQILLKGRGCNGNMYTPDGIFGKNTLGAVKLFQQKYGLVVDGIVGINTWSKLLGV